MPLTLFPPQCGAWWSLEDETNSKEVVGVYLDRPAGTLSFYRVSPDGGGSSDTLTHIHTFQSTFTQEDLLPGTLSFHVETHRGLCLRGTKTPGATRLLGQQQQDSWGNKTPWATRLPGQQDSLGNKTPWATRLLGQQDSWGNKTPGATRLQGHQAADAF
ncbi:unnamed protein product [Arctogadus glacialis]